MYQSLSSLEAIGFHADFDSIKKFGIRSEQVNVPYGMNAKQLKMIAVAEMTRRNGQAFTGSVTMPLRPEMRLGYPVYLEHIDTFYYVTGINHNFTFGSAATTDLTLQFKRERVFDDGNSSVPGSILGDVLYSCVMRDKEAEIAGMLGDLQPDIEKVQSAIKILTEASDRIKSGEKSATYNLQDVDKRINDLKKQIVSAKGGVFEGPGLMGLWKIDRANIKKKTKEQIYQAGDGASYNANELVMITNESVPYTDKLGYKHIGAFPYGANLVLTKDGQMRDMSNFTSFIEQSVDVQINSTGVRDETSSGVSSEANQDTQGNTENESTHTDEEREVTTQNFQNKLDKAYELQNDVKQQQNEQSNPNFNNNDKQRTGLASSFDIDTALMIQMDVPFADSDSGSNATIQNNEWS
jgi:hypothetical protein